MRDDGGTWLRMRLDYDGERIVGGWSAAHLNVDGARRADNEQVKNSPRMCMSQSSGKFRRCRVESTAEISAAAVRPTVNRTATSSSVRPVASATSPITRQAEAGGSTPSVADWLLVASGSDGEPARLHIRTKSRTTVRPMVLRIVIDTVTSGSDPKG